MTQLTNHQTMLNFLDYLKTQEQMPNETYLKVKEVLENDKLLGTFMLVFSMQAAVDPEYLELMYNGARLALEEIGYNGLLSISNGVTDKVS